MNTKITIAAAALASLLFASGAFAAGSEDYPAPVTHGPVVTARTLVNTQSSEAYPLFSPLLSTPSLAGPSLAMNNGSESMPEPVNSVPRGFDVGTQAYADQQVQTRWFAQQAQHRFASAQLVQAGQFSR